MRILVTGTAGFIGNALAVRLLDEGHDVAGLDKVTDFGGVAIREARLERIKNHPNFSEARIPLEDGAAVAALFRDFQPESVVHLAAQAGVRYSLEAPSAYVDSNLVGFANILEGCRHTRTGHLVFASSSSVYGANTKVPFGTGDNVDHPINLYAATKKSNELMAHSYSHLFGLPVTGVRFFTVYGPWGRPDMAVYAFTKAILEGKAIPLFNNGHNKRDFTYIDDVVEGLMRILPQPPAPSADWDSAQPNPATSRAPYRIFNLGNDEPVDTLYLVELLEEQLGKTAEKTLLPPQAGDMTATWADLEDFKKTFGFTPATPLRDGIAGFVAWFREYHQV